MKVIQKIALIKLCLIFSLLLCSKLSYSQYLGDSITIFIDNRVEVKIALDDYNYLKSENKISNALKNFQAHISKLDDQLLTNEADLIRYSVDSIMTLEKGDQKTILLLNNGNLKNTGVRDQAIIKVDDIRITIITNDLSKINDITLVNCFEKMVQLLPKKSNWSKSLYYQCTAGNVISLEDKQHTNSQIDVIELTAGTGASLIKNQWVGDFSIKLSTKFNRKGALWFNPYISTTLLYDFTTKGKMNINTFFNIGYRWNTNLKGQKPNMLGIEFGYLIARQGNTFDKNTFRLSLNWSPLDNITVSPQMYFSEGFKRVYPGIRIGFGL